jgi:hypothetical protein
MVILGNEHSVTVLWPSVGKFYINTVLLLCIVFAVSFKQFYSLLTS